MLGFSYFAYLGLFNEYDLTPSEVPGKIRRNLCIERWGIKIRVSKLCIALLLLRCYNFLGIARAQAS